MSNLIMEKYQSRTTMVLQTEFVTREKNSHLDDTDRFNLG
jgi:hypothetical protein